MNPKLSGTIFIIFGLGLAWDSTQELLSISERHMSISVLLFFLGLASCMYGIKQLKEKPEA